jgi:hypothetical protein
LNTKLARILLPVGKQGTADSCRQAAFGLARDFAARLEVLHLCPAAWQRLRYATEISLFYSEEVLDICRGQVSADQSEAKAWFEQAVLAHSGASADFQSGGVSRHDHGRPRPRRRSQRRSEHCRAGR